MRKNWGNKTKTDVTIIMANQAIIWNWYVPDYFSVILFKWNSKAIKSCLFDVWNWIWNKAINQWTVT